MVNYTKTVVNREGIYEEGEFTYTVNSSIEENKLTRLAVAIQKKQVEQLPDGNGTLSPVEQNVHVGNILISDGRRTGEFFDPLEDGSPHFAIFQKILDEVLGKEPETKTTKK